MKASKSDVINRMRVFTTLPRQSVEAIVDAFLTAVQEVAESGTRVSLHGFGAFETVHRAERDARNPATGKVVRVPARRVLKFTASKKK